MKQTINFQNSSKNVDIYIYIIFSQKYKSQLDPVRLVWSHFEHLCAMSTKKKFKKEKKKRGGYFQKWDFKKIIEPNTPI